jgi:hypothetical protein
LLIFKSVANRLAQRHFVFNFRALFQKAIDRAGAWYLQRSIAALGPGNRNGF